MRKAGQVRLSVPYQRGTYIIPWIISTLLASQISEAIHVSVNPFVRMFSSGGAGGLTYVSNLSRDDAIAAAIGDPTTAVKATVINNADTDLAMRTWDRLAPYDNTSTFMGITIPAGLSRPQFVWDTEMLPGETRYFAMAAKFTAPSGGLNGLVIAATNFADSAHNYRASIYDATTKSLVAESIIELDGNTTTPSIGLTEPAPFNWQTMRSSSQFLQASLISGTSYFVVVSYDAINYLNKPGQENPACIAFIIDVWGVPVPCTTPSCGWKEDPSNPVYNPPTQAYYQTVRYSSNQFSGAGPASFYKMWYDFSSAGGIALATSPDGTSWTFNTNMSGLVTTARHSRVLYDPNGFGIGAPYRIWYWDSAFLYVTDPVILHMLRTASSTDGINWFNDTPLSQDTSSPLLSPSAYNRGSYGPADILYFPQNPPVVDPVNPFNNRYVMYYDITDGSTEELALAVSADGVLWRKEGPLAVLPTGGTGSWDQNYATEGAVVLRLGPNNFMMWYSGGIMASHEGIGCASSIDGINWTKFAGNPVFSINDGVTWRNARTYNPWVLFDPFRFNGHGDSVCYKFWMSGAPTSASSDISIGYATNLSS